MAYVICRGCLRILSGRADFGSDVAGLGPASDREELARLDRHEEVAWPDPERGPWRITLVFGNIDGYSRLVELNIRGYVDGTVEATPTLTASVLRQLPLGTLETRARQGIGHDRAGKRPAEVDLAEVADVYREGGSTPTAAVAKHLGVSHTTAARRVQDARAAGLLEPTTKGRRSGPTTTTRGEITPEGRSALDCHDGNHVWRRYSEHPRRPPVERCWHCQVVKPSGQ